MKKLKYYLFLAAFVPLPLILILLFSNIIFRAEFIGFHSKTSFISTMLLSIGLPIIALIFKKQINPFNKQDK